MISFIFKKLNISISKYNNEIKHSIGGIKMINMDTIKSGVNVLYNGKKYITPSKMASILECENHSLCAAIEKHKRYLGNLDPQLLLVGNYGNANYKCNSEDLVYIQGWINFLSHYKDTDACQVVSILKEMD